MKRILAVLLLIPLTSGCAIFESGLEKRVDTLSRRVSALESHQVEEDVQAKGTGESVTFVSTVEVDEAGASSAGSLRMSKKEIQRALKNAGYYYGPIDGKLGNKSRRAIREFQADKGLKVDGMVGPQTRKALSRYLSIK